MSKMKRLLMLVICAIFVVSLVSVPEVRADSDDGTDYDLDGWVSEDGYYDWQYYEMGVPAQGWRTLDGYRYYFNSGYPVIGTVNLYNEDIGDYSEYRFNDEQYRYNSWYGEMITGWYNSEYYKEDGTRVKSGWLQLDEGWYYFKDGYYVTGTQKIGNATYYFDYDGIMMTDYWHGGCYYKSNGRRAASEWVKLDEVWYYFNSDGLRPSYQWIQSGGKKYYVADYGRMVTGLYYVDDSYYFFDNSGAMQTGWQKSDGKWYYFGADGKQLTGWQKVNNKWYYLDAYMYTGRQYIKDGYYLFNANGIMQANVWVKNEDGTWGYYKSNGKQANAEWLQIDGKWYYINSWYEMATGQTYINGSYYFFNNSGVMLSNYWRKVTSGNDTYYEYYKSNGKKAQNEWIQINGKWYYISSYMVTGQAYINNAYYYFSASGVMQTNYWYKRNDYGDYSYFKSNGKRAQNEWLQLNGKWYYFNDSGYMMFGGKRTINGKLYEFSSSGALLHANETGWKKVLDVNGNVSYYYYVNSGGSLATGWQKISGKWYYFSSYEGAMYRNTSYNIDGKLYYFDNSGAMSGENGGWVKGRVIGDWYDEEADKVIQKYEMYYANKGGTLVTGWKTIDGNQYYFDKGSGYMYWGGSYNINEKQYTFNYYGVLVS